MKNLLYLFSITLLLMAVNTSCYDRDIIDSKDGISLPTVTDLSATRSGTSATVTWNIPSNIPDEFNRPLTINIQVYDDKTRTQILEENSEVTSYTVTGLDAGKSYRIIVKLRGNFKEPEYGKSNDVYSLGQTVTIN